MTKIQENDSLSPILENYLEIIFHEEANEGAARSGSIAFTANVARSTMTSALKTLQKLGYIIYSPYSLIHLTPKGKKAGSKIVHRHIIFKSFFHKILQLDEGLADSAACKIEHAIDDVPFKRLLQFVYYMTLNTEKFENWQIEFKDLKKMHTKLTSEEEPALTKAKAVSTKAKPTSTKAKPALIKSKPASTRAKAVSTKGKLVLTHDE